MPLSLASSGSLVQETLAHTEGCSVCSVSGKCVLSLAQFCSHRHDLSMCEQHLVHVASRSPLCGWWGSLTTLSVCAARSCCVPASGTCHAIHYICSGIRSLPRNTSVPASGTCHRIRLPQHEQRMWYQCGTSCGTSTLASNSGVEPMWYHMWYFEFTI